MESARIKYPEKNRQMTPKIGTAALATSILGDTEQMAYDTVIPAMYVMKKEIHHSTKFPASFMPNHIITLMMRVTGTAMKNSSNNKYIKNVIDRYRPSFLSLKYRGLASMMLGM